MKPLIVLGGCIIARRLPANAGHHFRNKDKVNDQRRSQQGILANIEQANSLMTAHENLRIVFVESAFVVSDGWHVFDDYTVIWMLARLVEYSVGFDHIINNIRLGNLLGAKLLLRTQIHTVIVAQMVITCNRGEFQPSINHEVDECRLHLGLARFEIITSNECVVLLGELDNAWNKGVLRRAIDERSILENASYCKHSRRRNFLMATLNGVHEISLRVVHTFDDLCVTLGIRSPLNNYLVEPICRLEVTALLLADRKLEFGLNRTECPCEFALHEP